MAKKSEWESEMVPGVGFKEPTYAFVHCEKVEKSRIFGKEVFTGTNCSIQTMGKPIKCEQGGYDKLCLESVHLYDESPPTYPKR